ATAGGVTGATATAGFTAGAAAGAGGGGASRGGASPRGRGGPPPARGAVLCVSVNPNPVSPLRSPAPGRRRALHRRTADLPPAPETVLLRPLPDVEAEQVDEAAGRDPRDEKHQPIGEPEPRACLSRHPALLTSAREPRRRRCRARRAAPAGPRGRARAGP